MNQLPLRLLLIDDDEVSFELTRELLRDIGGRPIQWDWEGEFDSGLKTLLEDRHDVYLLDYRLGIRDGIDLLRQARAAGCQAPIIILTGQTDEAIDQLALQAGATDYLAKSTGDIAPLQHAIRYSLERQRLINELALERYLLRSLMENLPDNIYFKDRDSRFLRISAAMAKWFGLKDAGAAVGQTDHDFFTAEHADQARRDELELMRTAEPVLDLEEEETWHDGSTTWVSSTKMPLRDKDGHIVGTFGISRNITEWKQTLMALSRSERLNRMIVDTALDAFIAMDASGVIIDWNPQAEHIFGWSRIEALGESVASLIVPERFRAAHQAGLDAFLASGQGKVTGQRLELTALHRDGHEFPVEVSITPIQQEFGVIFAAFLHDITNRKRNESELRRAKEAAEAASRSKSDFLANMSHEIRTPMNAVIGLTELVLGSVLTDTQREYLSLVQSSGEALLVILNDILDFSKIEAGKMRLDSAEFDPRRLVIETVKSLAVRAQEKQLALDAKIAAVVPPIVIGDPARLRQILVNLIGNAIKFTATGGVTVSLGLDESETAGTRLHFAVTDTGIGVPPEKLDVIFHPFEQADTSTTRKYGGTGLGLTICSRLVECMRGRLWIESQVGVGTAVQFVVDLAVPSVPTAPPTEPGPTGDAVGLPTLRVLLAEDSVVNQKLALGLLRKNGHSVEVANNGHEAVELARSQQFDLILMDVQMPELDGLNATRLIREQEAKSTERVPIIAMTAHALAEDRELCLSAGMDGYVSKPVRAAVLWETIREVLMP